MPGEVKLSREQTEALDKKATEFTRALELTDPYRRASGDDGLVDAKRITEKFLNEALAMPTAEQNAVLKMAQEKNDQMRAKNSWVPGLNIVFSHRTKELTDVKLNYRHAGHGIETLDLFDP